MPVEIRELIIKTEVVSNSHNRPTDPDNYRDYRKALEVLKKQLLAECQRMLHAQQERTAFNR